MSQGSTASSLLRVTVASGSRRVDLVLPGSVPLAELVPELARSVGLLDPSTVYAGYRVVTADGRELVEDGGLIIQGIEDGGLLTVSARVDDDSPRVYDDVVEAMTDVVERDLLRELGVVGHPGDRGAPRLEPDPARSPRAPRPAGGFVPAHHGAVVGRPAVVAAAAGGQASPVRRRSSWVSRSPRARPRAGMAQGASSPESPPYMAKTWASVTHSCSPASA